MKVQSVTALLPASDFDLTIPGFGDVAGAIIWVSHSTFNGLTAWSPISFGFWAANGDQAAIGVQTQSGVATTNTGRGFSNVDCVMIPTAGGTVGACTRRGSAITDGIRLTKIDTGTATRGVFAIFFGECDFAVGSRQLGAGTETINLGFRANIVASAMNDLLSGSDIAAQTNAILHTGWASANFQAGSTIISQDAITTSSNVSDIRFVAPALRHWWTSGGPSFDVHIENFTDTGFDFRAVTRGKAPQGAHIWCAIGSGDAASDATMASGTSIANTLVNIGLGDDNGEPTEFVLGMTTYYDIAAEGIQELDNVYAWTTWSQSRLDSVPRLISNIDEDAQGISDSKGAIYDNGSLPIFSDQGTTNQGTGNLAIGDGVGQSIIGINMPSFSGQRFFGIALKTGTPPEPPGVKNIFLGGTAFEDIYVGAQQIAEAYAGSTLVWSAGPPPPSLPTDIVTDGLLQWFQLSNDACWDGVSTTITDLQGTQNALTNNSPTAIVRELARGMDFQNLNYYFDTQNSSHILPLGQDFTIEFVHRHNGSNTWRFDNRGPSRATLHTGNQFTIFGVADYILTASQPSDVIYIETLVADGNNFKRYINGVQVDNRTISTARTLSGTVNHWYGASHNSSGGFSTYYRGELYDLKWYKDKALSAAEVTQNYNAQKEFYGL